MDESQINQEDKEDQEQEQNQEQEQSEEQFDQYESQNHNQEHNQLDLPESYKSWELNDQEVKFLNELYNEIQEAQSLANGLKEEAKLADDGLNQAQRDSENVNNVVSVLKDETDKEDDVKFAIDNALLLLATSKRKVEDENEYLRQVIRDRNQQLRILLLKVKEQEKELQDRNQYIRTIEQELSSQNQTLKQLQTKVDDEYRFKVIQEQLRKPVKKDKYLYDNNKFVDNNVKDDPFDFWSSNGPNINFEPPGGAKKLNEVVNKKQLWVSQKEESNSQLKNSNNFWK